MVPKPFPFPLGIGVDIVKVSRIRRLMADQHLINKWARKVFNRLEWLHLFDEFNSALDEPLEWHAQDPGFRLNLPHVWETRREEFPDLTRLRKPSRPLSTAEISDFESGDLSPKTMALAFFLAGRWAAKEAAIKAHRYRKLYPRDISVIRAYPGDERLAPGKPLKPHVLIDPPSRIISISRDVAVSRGLQEPSKSIDNPTPSFKRPTTDNPSYVRRDRVKAEERQVAEMNITHDGDYVVAVCMAVDKACERKDEETKPIVDNGVGDPVHEPVWGDEGFLDNVASV